MIQSPKFLMRLETITFLVITLLGLYNGKVTAFYLIYFFWFQELIRTIIDTGFIIADKQPFTKPKVIEILSCYIILSIYFIFIAIVFGWIMAFRELGHLGENLKIILFQNWFFNINLILFAAEYFYFRRLQKEPVHLHIFNHRHIILHISVVIGMLLHGLIKDKITEQSGWLAIAAVLPFIVLKLFLDKKEQSELPNNQHH